MSKFFGSTALAAAVLLSVTALVSPTEAQAQTATKASPEPTTELLQEYVIVGGSGTEDDPYLVDDKPTGKGKDVEATSQRHLMDWSSPDDEWYPYHIYSGSTGSHLYYLHI